MKETGEFEKYVSFIRDAVYCLNNHLKNDLDFKTMLNAYISEDIVRRDQINDEDWMAEKNNNSVYESFVQLEDDITQRIVKVIPSSSLHGLLKIINIYKPYYENADLAKMFIDEFNISEKHFEETSYFELYKRKFISNDEIFE